MTRFYLGFAGELHRLVTGRMRDLAQRFGGDEWAAAASVIPTLEAKFRDQLATEHLVRCYHAAASQKAYDPRSETPRRARPQQESTMVILASMGVTSNQVKQWAVTQGLLTEVKRGQVSRALIMAYLAAYQGRSPEESLNQVENSADRLGSAEERAQ